jgi:hypothetical protein
MLLSLFEAEMAFLIEIVPANLHTLSHVKVKDTSKMTVGQSLRLYVSSLLGLQIVCALPAAFDEP